MHIVVIIHSNEEIATLVINCLKSVFESDVQGSVTYAIVQQMATVMKNKNYRIPPRAIQSYDLHFSFLTINISIH